MSHSHKDKKRKQRNRNPYYASQAINPDRPSSVNQIVEEINAQFKLNKLPSYAQMNRWCTLGVTYDAIIDHWIFLQKSHARIVSMKVFI